MFSQLKTQWNCDKLWKKSNNAFDDFSQNQKWNFKRKNWISFVLEKIPKKLLFLNKKEVIQNCFFFYSQNIIWISSIFVSSVPFENFDFIK